MNDKQEKETLKTIPLNMDEILKILFHLSSTLTIRMINSLFQQKIPLDTEVFFENNEIYRMHEKADTVDELRVDLLLHIAEEQYHIEFQTVNDTLMPLKLFEYGFYLSIRKIKSFWQQLENGICLDFPKQYVIFIEKNESIPKNQLSMKVILWDGDEKEYSVPIMRYWEEDLDSLEQKHLVLHPPSF